MFTFTIKTDNVAFDNGNKFAELARILREVADQVEDGIVPAKVRDINGNLVGAFDIKG